MVQSFRYLICLWLKLSRSLQLWVMFDCFYVLWISAPFLQKLGSHFDVCCDRDYCVLYGCRVSCCLFSFYRAILMCVVIRDGSNGNLQDFQITERIESLKSKIESKTWSNRMSVCFVLSPYRKSESGHLE